MSNIQQPLCNPNTELQMLVIHVGEEAKNIQFSSQPIITFITHFTFTFDIFLNFLEMVLIKKNKAFLAKFL